MQEQRRLWRILQQRELLEGRSDAVCGGVCVVERTATVHADKRPDKIESTVSTFLTVCSARAVDCAENAAIPMALRQQWQWNRDT
jgi:hypothetical protein